MNFRRWIVALSVLLLFAGLAGAQTTVQGALTCQTQQGTTTPLVRAEGFTELVGQIVLNCTGTQTLAVGSVIPTANFTIAMNAPVTSRILSSSSSASEALLLIDEPGSSQIAPVPGFGPQAPQMACSSIQGATANGCGVQYVATVAGTQVATTDSTGASSGAGFYPANVFQGVVSANQVTFYGVPILPPGSTGVSRTFRIVNIRVNANYIGVPPANTVLPVTASISTNPFSVIAVGAAQPVVGFVNQGLVTSMSTSGAASFLQCTSVKLSGSTSTTLGASTYVGNLNFKEGFGTAFKTRSDPVVAAAATGSAAYASQSVILQNIPNATYNSESGFVTGLFSSGGSYPFAGVADFGTRLKAYFTNVPAGVHIYVSVNNVASYDSTSGLSNVTAPSTIGGSDEVHSYAGLVQSEGAVGGTGAFGGVSGFPGVTGTFTASILTGSVPAAEIPLVNGSGVAVWEVLNSNPSAIETFRFAVFTTYASNASAGTPIGTSQVTQSFAPTPTPNYAGATFGAASASLPIPRFADGTPSNLFTISLCQTVLLWPYVTTLTGFNTGFAIANTSVDPGTAVITNASGGSQSGTCSLYLYGTAEFGTLPTNPFLTTPAVAGGTVYANDLASILGKLTTPASVSTGYMFGLCNFSYAHGYAAISDSKAANWVTSYLALVVTPGVNALRGPTTAEDYIH